MIRLGILGCGAVTSAYHLPAAISTKDLEVTALVDTNLGRARVLRKKFGLGSRLVEDYRAVADSVDCVVNALPNRLHHPVSRFFLKRRIPVLCEKPLATSAAEARDLVELADSEGVPLAVGHVLRFHEASQIIKEILANGVLGRLRSFEMASGYAAGWESASGYDLSFEDLGGGVMMTNGIHLLDLLVYWFGSPTDVTYRDDRWEEMEANVEAHISFRQGDEDFAGTLKLSRTDDLKNQTWIYGERASVEMHDNNSESVFLHLDGESHQLRIEVTLRDGIRPRPTISYFRDQLANFLDAVRGEEELKVSGASNLAAVELLETCYRIRKPLQHPWALVR